LKQSSNIKKGSFIDTIFIDNILNILKHLLRYQVQLRKQLEKLDQEYDKAQECMSNGELADFKGSSLD